MFQAFPQGCDCFCYFRICTPGVYLLLWYAPSGCFLKPLFSETLLREEAISLILTVSWSMGQPHGHDFHLSLTETWNMKLKSLPETSRAPRTCLLPSSFIAFIYFVGSWWLVPFDFIGVCRDMVMVWRGHGTQSNYMNYYYLENMYCTLIMFSKISVSFNLTYSFIILSHFLLQHLAYNAHINLIFQLMWIAIIC